MRVNSYYGHYILSHSVYFTTVFQFEPVPNNRVTYKLVIVTQMPKMEVSVFIKCILSEIAFVVFEF